VLPSLRYIVLRPKHYVGNGDSSYTCRVPKLWSDTIEAHRQDVRAAILDATADLVAERGPLSVTMSQIAETAGIGRATLYKYFPDVEAILVAWHERHVAAHLDHLAAIRDRAGDAFGRLEAVLGAYALIVRRRRQHAELAFLHRDEHTSHAQEQLMHLVEGLVADAAETGDIRDDVAPAELASYCLHALEAAANARSDDALSRLVQLTLAGLRPAPWTPMD
jgi:AcrR family transcriptional regulator